MGEVLADLDEPAVMVASVIQVSFISCNTDNLSPSYEPMNYLEAATHFFKSCPS